MKVGLVASISRPGGNITGVTNISVETASKRFELMRELLPGVNVIGFLQNPRNPNTPVIIKDIETAANALGRKAVILDFTNKDDLDKAFATLVQQGIKALVITADPIASNWRDEIIELAARHAIPTMYPYRDFVEAGGLVSYGANFSDVYRQVGTYTARILRGESPSELPVVQSTKFELVVNNKTARSLALEVPLSLLMRIDSVID